MESSEKIAEALGPTSTTERLKSDECSTSQGSSKSDAKSASHGCAESHAESTSEKKRRDSKSLDGEQPVRFFSGYERARDGFDVRVSHAIAEIHIQGKQYLTTYLIQGILQILDDYFEQKWYMNFFMSPGPKPSARDRIYIFRRRKGLSQKQLADLLKTHESVVSRYEKGRRKLSKRTAQRLAELIGCDFRELL